MEAARVNNIRHVVTIDCTIFVVFKLEVLATKTDSNDNSCGWPVNWTRYFRVFEKLSRMKVLGSAPSNEGSSGNGPSRSVAALSNA
eukprot:6118362-Amphidinium_carterae.1